MICAGVTNLWGETSRMAHAPSLLAQFDEQHLFLLLLTIRNAGDDPCHYWHQL